MNQQVRDLIELHFLVLLWGFTAVLGLLIEMPSVEIVFYRTLISFVVMGLGLLLAGRSLIVGLRELLPLLGVGALFAAHWIAFFLAAKISNASLCLAGMATTALWSSVIEPLADRNKKLSLLQVVLSIIAIFGIAIVLNVEFDRALGLFVAILAALLAALFTVSNKFLVKKHSPYKIMFYEMLGAFGATSVFLPFYSEFFTDQQLMLSPSAMDWFYLSILAVVCTVYAYTMSVKLLKRISAFMVNFTINLEPVYGILLAFLVLGDSERMSVGFYGGTGLILLSVIIYPFLQRKLNRSI